MSPGIRFGAAPALIPTPPTTPSKSLKREERSSVIPAPPPALEDPVASSASAAASASADVASSSGTPSKRSKSVGGAGTEVVVEGGRSTRSKGTVILPFEALVPGLILRATEIQCHKTTLLEGTLFRVIEIVGRSQLVVVSAQQIEGTREGKGKMTFTDAPVDPIALKLQVRKAGTKVSDLLEDEYRKSVELALVQQIYAKKGPAFLIPLQFKANISYANPKNAAKYWTTEWSDCLTGVGMELGVCLSTAIHPPTTPARTNVLFSAAFTALDSLHASNYVHRDVKADNFLVRLKKDPESGAMLESDEVLLIDCGSVVKKRKEWDFFGLKRLHAIGAASHMPLSVVSQIIMHQVREAEREGKLKTWKSFDLGVICGLAMASSAATVLETADYWALGMSLLLAIDPIWFHSKGNVLTDADIMWFHDKFSGNAPPSFDVARARVSALASIFSGIVDARSYLYRVDEAGTRLPGPKGMVDEGTFGSILEKLLRREEVLGADSGPKRKLTASDVVEDMQRLITSSQPGESSVAGAALNTASTAATSVATPLPDAPCGSAPLAGPSLASKSKSTKKSSRSDLPPTRVEIPVPVPSHLEGDSLIFIYPISKPDRNIKRAYMLVCGLPGCKSPPGDGPYKTKNKPSMATHLRGSPENKIRCIYFQSDKALPMIEMKFGTGDEVKSQTTTVFGCRAGV